MSKQDFTRPVLIMLYGFPGSGKTFFARQLCEDMNLAHVYDDKIRNELFEKPMYDRHENEIVKNIMNYMTEEFLNTGVSVVYDANAMHTSKRRALRDLSLKFKAEPVLIWLQIDIESAFIRVVKRDKRKADDKYASSMDRTTFESIVQNMQNPHFNENYVVLSGKHTYSTQKQMTLKKLFDMGLVLPSNSSSSAKPELVNRIPNAQAGRVNSSRRNIFIR